MTDNRRLSLWVAFSLSLLGAFGLERLARGDKLARSWVAVWILTAGLLGGISILVPRFEPLLRQRAEEHYKGASEAAPQPGMASYLARGERQVQAALVFLPRYYGLAACELLVLAVLAVCSARQGLRPSRCLPALLTSLTLIELAHFGMGLNPAIDPAIHRFEPPVVKRLCSVLEPGERALGVGEELPPNVLMRFGLGDPRNYDSVELSRSLLWFASVFEPGSESLTSRSQITWESVHRARDRLQDACVKAVVGASPPRGRTILAGRANRRCLDRLAGLAGLGQQPSGVQAGFDSARLRSVGLANQRAGRRPDSDPGNLGCRLDRPHRRRPCPCNTISRYVHVGICSSRTAHSRARI